MANKVGMKRPDLGGNFMAKRQMRTRERVRDYSHRSKRDAFQERGEREKVAKVAAETISCLFTDKRSSPPPLPAMQVATPTYLPQAIFRVSGSFSQGLLVRQAHLGLGCPPRLERPTRDGRGKPSAYVQSSGSVITVSGKKVTPSLPAHLRLIGKPFKKISTLAGEVGVESAAPKNYRKQAHQAGLEAIKLEKEGNYVNAYFFYRKATAFLELAEMAHEVEFVPEKGEVLNLQSYKKKTEELLSSNPLLEDLV